jgi:LysM repeat protein
MNAIAAALLITLAASELAVSPDQPLPYSYIDEPLVVELTPDFTGTARLSGAVEGETKEGAKTFDLGEVDLSAGRPYWFALKDIPQRTGYFTLRATLAAPGGEQVLSAPFSRIRRAAGEHHLPLFGVDAGDAPETLRALKGIPLRTLRVDMTQPDAMDRARMYLREGFQIVPYIDATAVPNPAEHVTALAAELCSGVARWEVYAGESVPTLSAISQALRAAGCATPLTVAARDVAQFDTMMKKGLGNVVRSVAVSANGQAGWTVEAVHRMAEHSGFEDWTLYAVLENGTEDSGSSLLKQIFQAWAQGYAEAGFNTSAVYNKGLSPAFNQLNALTYRLGPMRFAGSLPLKPEIVNYLFTSGADWYLALWSEGAESTVKLEPGDAMRVEAFDQYNNRLAIEADDKGEIEIPVSQRPVYLSGRGGKFFEQAARAQAVRLACGLVQRKDIDEAIGSEVRAAVAAVPGNRGMLQEREQFFTLIRSLPRIEQQWHAGDLPRPVAASTIAHLTRLIRQLCVMEQLRGEPFIEPLSDTLARCKEYQAFYLTSSSGSDDTFERGDWLLNEVRRLMDEAESLSEAGRRIEASAVAALAEWRARGLEFAARAGEAVQVAEAPATEVALELPSVPIPADTAAAPDPVLDPEGGAVHTVKRGDTLGGIATRYKVKLSDLLQWNNLTTRSTLRLGQKIKVLSAAAPAAPAEAPASVAGTDPEPLPTPEPEPELAPTPATTVATHTVKRGDTLAGIAAKHKVSLADLLKWNKLTATSRLNIGQKILVGEAGAEAAEAPAEAPDAEPQVARETPLPSAEVHIVKSGNTLAGIASTYRVPLDDLLKWNNLTRRATLRVGQEIRLRPAGDNTSAPEAPPEAEPGEQEEQRDPGKVIHTVERGDTTKSIAAQYGVSEADFRSWNGIRAGAQLARGKQYVVHVSGGTPAKPEQEAGQKTITHTVQRGDSPFTIAKKYNVSVEDFLKWNKLTSKSVLHIGQKYMIQVGE